ncbi:MAG: hypothetical protein EPN91_10725 [Salinibacterium sp.]|nr:MAG: hypothetical protein EPN91_10725 [Salinibacterium sp.]
MSTCTFKHLDVRDGAVCPDCGEVIRFRKPNAKGGEAFLVMARGLPLPLAEVDVYVGAGRQPDDLILHVSLPDTGTEFRLVLTPIADKIWREAGRCLSACKHPNLKRTTVEGVGICDACGQQVRYRPITNPPEGDK